MRARPLPPALLLAPLLLTACSASDRATYRTLRQIAGNSAINCGRASTEQALASTNRCVLDADRNHRPFFVRYQALADDSTVTFGLARSPDGRLLRTSIDHDPNGGNRDSILFNRGRISVHPCVSHSVAASRGMLTCDP